MENYPLGAAVAVVGSRHGSPYGVARLVGAVVAAGGLVVTGCAAGVDHSAATAAAAGGRPALVFRAQAQQAWALAKRTELVVGAAQAVAVFPPAGGVLGPGSALALRLALARRLPVFVAGPQQPAPAWEPVRVGGVAGWLLLPAMPSLF